jgi:type IV secretory pathway VirB10-like protein
MKTTHAGGMLVVALFGIGAAPAAFAQKTYRCGNTYQSYPCATNSATAGGAGADAKAKPAAQSIKTPEPPPPTPEELKAAAAKDAQVAEAKKQEAAVKEKKARCDKIRNDLDYNSAQQKASVSNTTMERLKGERKQIDADMKKEAC